MDSYIKSETNQTLDIFLNVSNGIFLFKGISIPEDCQSFFNPIVNWMKEYIKNPCETTELIFDIVYINTSSTMYFIQMLKVLQPITEVSIKWNYHKGDDDMVVLGEDLKRISLLDFTLIELPARD